MKKQIWLNIGFYLIGLCIFAFGIALTICADYGVGCWDAVGIGCSQLWKGSIGFWLTVQSIGLLLVTALLLRKPPRFSCLITAMILNSFLDFFHYEFLSFTIQDRVLGLFAYVLGTVFICLGCGIYLVSDYMPNPIDAFMLAIKKRWNLSITWAMGICEITGCILACFVRGPIGIGTVLCVILYGPLIHYFHTLAKSMHKKVVINESNIHRNKKIKQPYHKKKGILS